MPAFFVRAVKFAARRGETLPVLLARRRVVVLQFIAVLVSLALAMGVVSVSLLGNATPDGPAPLLGVPAYFTAEDQWTPMLAEPSALGLVIINPASGPGKSADPAWRTRIARARAAGATPLAYVATSYANRPIDLVFADLHAYRTFYGLSSFFLDEVPSVCSEVRDGNVIDYLNYYARVAAEVRKAGGTLALNPGVNVSSCYLDVSDVIVTFESSAADYASWTPDPWTRTVPANRFWHLVFAAAPDARESIAKAAGARNVGYVYVTDLPGVGKGTNPWASLGSLQSFSALRTALRRTAATVSTTTVSTTTVSTTTVSTTVTTVATAATSSTTPSTTSVTSPSSVVAPSIPAGPVTSLGMPSREVVVTPMIPPTNPPTPAPTTPAPTTEVPSDVVVASVIAQAGVELTAEAGTATRVGSPSVAVFPTVKDRPVSTQPARAPTTVSPRALTTSKAANVPIPVRRGPAPAATQPKTAPAATEPRTIPLRTAPLRTAPLRTAPPTTAPPTTVTTPTRPLSKPRSAAPTTRSADTALGPVRR